MPNAREIESTTGSFPFEKRFAPTDCAYNITIIHCRDNINRIGNIDSVDSIVEVYSKNNIDRVDSPSAAVTVHRKTESICSRIR